MISTGVLGTFSFRKLFTDIKILIHLLFSICDSFYQCRTHYENDNNRVEFIRGNRGTQINNIEE